MERHKYKPFFKMESQKKVNKEFANNVFKNMMQLYFNPEITKRKNKKLIPDDFNISAAQAIIFPDGRETIIRFNNEVRAEVKIKKGINTDKENFWPTSSEIELIKLCEKEFSNCGHVTIVLLKDGFKLSFDFRYNKQICEEHLKVAKQFIETSRFALEKKFTFAFLDNSFSAMELLAKTNLLIEANPNMVGKTSHKTIKTTFNSRYKDSQTEFEIKRRQILNRLSEVRANARYVQGEVLFDEKEKELDAIFQTIEIMYSDLSINANFNND